MSEPRLDGQRAVLVGDAEPALVEATIQALRAAGADAERIGESDIATGDAFDVCACFARTETGAPLDDSDATSLQAAVDVALAVPQRLVMTAARRMAAADGGAIIVVGSVDASHAYAGRAAASIAMGGLLGLVRSIAVELSGDGIRANLVLAGPIDPSDGASAPDDDARVSRTLQRSPMGRFAMPSEAAAAIRFLASLDSDFMTGQTLRVDGGWASLNQAPEGMRFP